MFKINCLIKNFSKLSIALNNNNNNNRILNYIRYFSVDSSSSSLSSIPDPPKRSSNVFALFVRDCFKRLPSDMSVKEKFVQAGQEWRQLSPEEKEHYQKMGTEEFVKYKTALNSYLESLSPEEMVQFEQKKRVIKIIDNIKNYSNNLTIF